MQPANTEFLAENLLDHIPVGVLNVEISGKTLFANKAALKILGLEKSEVVGRSFSNSDLTHIDIDGVPLMSADLPLSIALSEERPVKDFVMGIKRSDGTIWISANAAPLYNTKGSLEGGILSFSDISNRIVLEKEYRNEATLHRHSDKSVQAVFWERSLKHDKMAYVGPKVEEMLGYTIEERSAKGFWEAHIHPDDKEEAISFNKNQLELGRSHEFEYRFKKGDGKYIWIRDIVDVTVEDGKSVYIRGLMMDITKNKIMSRKLKESEDLYKLLAENTTDLVSVHDLDFSYKFISPSIEVNLGYSEKELLDRKQIDLIHPEDKGLFREASKNVILGNKRKIRYRIKHKDESYLWFEGELDPVYNDHGDLSLIRNSSRQIHEKTLAENKLTESEERNRSLIMEAPFSISIHDTNGILIKANSAFEETWDLHKDELIGKFNIHKEEAFESPELRTCINKAFDGEKGDLVTKFKTVKNRTKDIHIKYFPLINSNKEIYNVVFVTEDITAKLAAERKVATGETLKQGILNSLEDAILVVDKDGTIISINKRLQSYIKNSPYKGIEIGENAFSFIDFFEESGVIKSGLEKVLKRTTTFFDYETKLADNKWYNLKVTQLKKPYGAVIFWQNINTRKEIEIALEKSLKKYRNIYNRAPVMMHSVNSNSEIMSVSDFWLEKMGYERNEVIGKEIIEFIAKTSKDIATESLKEFFSKGYIRNVHYSFKTKNGEILDVLLSATSEYDDEGNFERSLAGMVDVTELRKTERELLKSRQNLIEAQRISKIGNYELNLKDYSFDPSSEVIAIMGLSRKHKDLRIMDELIHPNDKADFIEKLKHSSKTGDDFFHIYRINHLRSHKVKWISARGKVTQNESGENLRMIGTVQDISEQKVAEDKIRRLSDRILLATELTEIGVWEYNLETDDVFWDKQMFEIFENAKKPIKRFEELSKYLHKEDNPILSDLSEKIKKGVRFIETDLRIKINGRVKYIRTYNRIIRNSKQKAIKFIGVMYDNTRDKKLQLQLESSLEEKNILLKEVHHRVKNNMQLVSSILALKAYDLKDENSKKIFSEINDRIKSMAVIHDQLYKFYNVSEVNISDYLNHIARELRVLFGSVNTNIVVEADNKLFEVDQALLFGLIVSELASNAFKHSFEEKESGVVKIVFETKGSINILSVLNDGAIIPANILSEKPKGLGISLIKTFTKQLNGELTLSKKNGFQIQFESR